MVAAFKQFKIAPDLAPVQNSGLVVVIAAFIDGGFR